MNKELARIQDIIMQSARQAREETSAEPEPELTSPPAWPVDCKVGPGLEGAIACESKVGYVNGSKGWLVYRGYDIFDLCAFSNFEEVSYLLLHGRLPDRNERDLYRKKLLAYGHLNKTLRLLMGFPIEEMHVMGALRLGTNLMRHEFTSLDRKEAAPDIDDAISCDEDSIAMETAASGSDRATYEFSMNKNTCREGSAKEYANGIRYGNEAIGLEACYHLIAGVSTITAAIARIHNSRLPLQPDPELSFAANLLYMISGRKPSPVEERIMDICLILHADHGMNASTFAAMVVASTLSDIYFSVGAGISALSGPLHGGANEAAIRMLHEIGKVENVAPWVHQKLTKKEKIPGFGHRVYKAYDPRARILGPLAEFLVKGNPGMEKTYQTATALEKTLLSKWAAEKKIFPNVDFYSGIVYSCLGIDFALFTPLFAASRVAGWTARVVEYIENNRIFRPRAIYTGEFNLKYPTEIYK
ncbi:MAG: citrate/2-methylcitrate synthase [Thermodesulfobacteriota bacterium]